MIIVKSQIKEAVKSVSNIDNVSADFAEKLNEKVMLLIKDACQRAKENNRKTLMGKDV